MENRRLSAKVAEIEQAKALLEFELQEAQEKVVVVCDESEAVKRDYAALVRVCESA